MKLGMVLYQLWHRRLVLVLSLLIAVFAAVDSAYKVGLGTVTPRSIGMSTASTQILVDNPNTIVLDLNQGSYQLQQMSQSATLLGNIIVSPTVLQDVAKRVGIPMGLIQTSAPATTQFPQAITSPSARKTTDLLSSNDQYRINVQANPTVPILDIYTEAHSPTVAKGLANAAVVGLRDYLATFGAKVPEGQRVRIEQLGPAQGGAVTGGLRVEVMALVFGFAFVIAAAVGLFLVRAKEGWRASDDEAPSRSTLATTNGHLDLG